MLVFMYQIIIILINLFNIKAFEAQLVILVDDYLEYVIVDDQNKNLDNYQQTEAKTYSSNININYGSIIKITLSNYDGDFGLSAKLSFHNGKENEIYSTNDSYLWKINDTRCENNYPVNKDYTCSDIANSYIIGAVDARPPDYHNIRYTYYTYILNIYGFAFCKNEKNKRNIKAGELFNLDVESLIYTKLQTKTGFQIKFEYIDSLLILKDSNNIEVQQNTLYDINGLKYQMNLNGSSYFEYYIVYGTYNSPKCTLTFFTCSNSCDSCRGSSPTECCESNQFYNFKKDNCEEIPHVPEGKYYDKYENSIKNCYTSCKKCNIGGNENSHNCLECKPDYHPIYNTLNSNCYKDPQSYYLNHSSGLYFKCYDSCLECNTNGEKESPNCLSNKCANDAYPLENNLTFCIFENDISIGYSLINNVIVKCHENCATCSKKEEIGKMNCLTCKTNFYLLNSNCVESEEGYYLDNGELKECYINCKTCSTGYDLINQKMNCDSCKETLYQLEGKIGECINENEKPENYYKSSNNFFSLCKENCSSCSDNLSCNSCSTGYKFIPNDNNKICYEEIPEGYYNDTNDNQYYSKCDISCKTCKGKKIDEYNTNCLICQNNYYNVESYENLCISQNENLIGYYKEHNNKLFRKCDPGCDECELNIEDNGLKCRKCNKNYFLDDYNCVLNCDIYFYRINGYGYCINECNDDLSILYNEKQCIKDCSEVNLYQENNLCVNQCSEGYILKNNKICEIKEKTFIEDNFDLFFKKLENEIFNYKTNIIYNGDYFSFEIVNIKEPYTYKSNLSVINLKDCETALKSYYSIPENEYLFIAKFDIKILKNNKTNYLSGQVRFQIFDSKGNKLDISICKENPILIEYALDFNNSNVNLSYSELMSNLGIDVFNSEDNYFNDICEPSKGENADLTLNHRREKQFIEVNICEEGCEYNGVNYTTLKAICNCDVSVSNNPINNIKDVKKAFTHSIPKTNVLIGKCYITFTKFKFLKSNIGFWFFSSLIILDIFFCFHFGGYGMKSIRNIIKEIISQKPKNNPPKFNKNNFLFTNFDNKNSISSEIHLQQKNEIKFKTDDDLDLANSYYEKNNKKSKTYRLVLNENNNEEFNIKNDQFIRKYKKINTCKTEIKNDFDEININPFNEREKRSKSNKTLIKFNQDDFENNPLRKNYKRMNTCQSEFIIEPDEFNIKNPFTRRNRRYNTEFKKEPEEINIENPFNRKEKRKNTNNFKNIIKDEDNDKDNYKLRINKRIQTYNIQFKEEMDNDELNNNKEKIKKNNIKSINKLDKKINSIVSFGGAEYYLPKNSTIKSKNDANISLKKINREKSKKSSFKKINSNSELINLTIPSECNNINEKTIEQNMLTHSSEMNEKYIKSKDELFLYIHTNDLIIKDDDDIDNAPYYKAVKEDKRKFLNMFWCYFSDNLNFTSAVSKKNEFDLISIKLTVLITELSIDFCLNAIFYDDNIIEEKYNNGKLSFATELLRSTYSFLVAIFITYFVNKLSYFNYLVILKREFDYTEDYISICQKFLYRMKKNLIIMFIINFILMLGMLYYCTIFCYIFSHNQIDWFKGGWISIIISFATSLGIAFIISFLRYIALSKKMKYIYNASCFLNNIF